MFEIVRQRLAQASLAQLRRAALGDATIALVLLIAALFLVNPHPAIAIVFFILASLEGAGSLLSLVSLRARRQYQ